MSAAHAIATYELSKRYGHETALDRIRRVSVIVAVAGRSNRIPVVCAVARGATCTIAIGIVPPFMSVNVP